MAYTVDWIAKVITVPTSDLILVSGTRYQLDMLLFLTECRRLEWEFNQGLWAPAILIHTNKKVDFAGADYAGFDEILNGYTVQFTGVAQRVDIIASNNNLVDVFIVTAIALVPSNSAGLITNESTVSKMSTAVWESLGTNHVLAGTMGFVLNQITYQNKIWIDPLNTTGNAITGVVPGINGTPTAPCLNPADAKVLGTGLNIATLKVLSATELDRDFPRWEFEGTRDVLFNPAGFDITSAELRGLCLAGNFSGYKVNAQDSAIGDDVGSLKAMNLYGDFVHCVLNEVGATLAAGGTIFADCHSSVAGTGRPTLDFQGIAGVNFSLRNYSGGFEPLNMSDADNKASLEFVAGKLTSGATNTAGTIELRGTVGLNDSANGGTVINVEEAVNTNLITNSVWDEIVAGHAISGSTGESLSLSASSGSPKVEIKQAWTRALTGGSKMRALASLHLDGQIVILPGTATLDIIVRDSAGTALIAQSGITANAEGYFSLTEDPYSPSAGVNLASFATITNGGDVYNDLTPLSFPEFV